MRRGILYRAVLGTLLFATVCTAQTLRTCTTPFSAPHQLQRWPSTAALAPIPNATVHLFGAAQYPDTGSVQPCFFAHFCSDDLHASPLVVHISETPRLWSAGAMPVLRAASATHALHLLRKSAPASATRCNVCEKALPYQRSIPDVGTFVILSQKTARPRRARCLLLHSRFTLANRAAWSCPRRRPCRPGQRYDAAGAGPGAGHDLCRQCQL